MSTVCECSHACRIFFLPGAVLSRRTFPPPRTLGMVEPGYRDAPAADEPVAFVYVKVCAVLMWGGLQFECGLHTCDQETAGCL